MKYKVLIECKMHAWLCWSHTLSSTKFDQLSIQCVISLSYQKYKWNRKDLLILSLSFALSTFACLWKFRLFCILQKTQGGFVFQPAFLPLPILSDLQLVIVYSTVGDHTEQMLSNENARLHSCIANHQCNERWLVSSPDSSHINTNSQISSSLFLCCPLLGFHLALHTKQEKLLQKFDVSNLFPHIAIISHFWQLWNSLDHRFRWSLAPTPIFQFIPSLILGWIIILFLKVKQYCCYNLKCPGYEFLLIYERGQGFLGQS